jgi:translation initiation factor 1A
MNSPVLHGTRPFKRLAWVIRCGFGFNLGKRLVKNEGDLRRGMMYPNKNDILGIVVKNYGQTRMNVKCQDGETRICRVRGKMKKRRWVREGDVVLVSPWDFQSEEKGDIIFRYTSNQAYWLRENNYLNLET